MNDILATWRAHFMYCSSCNFLVFWKWKGKHIYESYYLFQGPSTDEVKIEVDDMNLLRIARMLHPDNLMPISASLVGNVQFLRKLEQQYQGFNPSDFAFMILHEWKISNTNKRQVPTVAMLLDVFEDLHIDKHHLCQVYHITTFLILEFHVPLWRMIRD